MNLGFDPEQDQLRRIVRDFATRELLPRYAHWDRSGAFPLELWRRMGELGLCGARVPAVYNGQEMSAVTTGIVAEEVARGDFNLSYGVLMPALCGEVLREHAGERVKPQHALLLVPEPGRFGTNMGCLEVLIRRGRLVRSIRGSSAHLQLRTIKASAPSL